MAAMVLELSMFSPLGFGPKRSSFGKSRVLSAKEEKKRLVEGDIRKKCNLGGFREWKAKIYLVGKDEILRLGFWI